MEFHTIRALSASMDNPHGYLDVRICVSFRFYTYGHILFQNLRFLKKNLAYLLRPEADFFRQNFIF